jgi:hypothetical protein
MSAGAKWLRAANSQKGSRERTFFEREAREEQEKAEQARLGRREFGDPGVGLAILEIANRRRARGLKA